MDTLFTILGFVTLAVNVALVFIVNNSATDAENEARSLRVMRGRIIALEAAHESLHQRHQKLAGKYYASAANADATVERCPNTQDFVGDEHAPGWCENYGLAQVQGPQSKAAKCECAFCEHMREQRAALRKSLPVNHLQAVKSIEAAS